MILLMWHLLMKRICFLHKENNLIKVRIQLKDIIDRARVTVVMFDENQILTTEQFWESQILEKYRNQAKATNNYIVLDKQLRMQADAATMGLD